ncbi:MAG TPA: hypothetical protein VG917_00875 [Patescibacteria group bacterium]|nr:hypothetical protein [Patescibacteria group bacterium]
MSNEFLPEITVNQTEVTQGEKKLSNLEVLRELSGHLVTSLTLYQNIAGETTSNQPHTLQVSSVETDGDMMVIKGTRMGPLLIGAEERNLFPTEKFHVNVTKDGQYPTRGRIFSVTSNQPAEDSRQTIYIIMDLLE